MFKVDRGVDEEDRPSRQEYLRFYGKMLFILAISLSISI
jgi:hypothetical protein